MKPDRAYLFAVAASTAWHRVPMLPYRLTRLHSHRSEADLPAMFQVWRDGVKLGKMTVGCHGAFYGGFMGPQLSEAVKRIRREIEG